MYIFFHTFAYLKSSVTALLRENWDHGHRTNLQSTAFIGWIWWRVFFLTQIYFLCNKSFIYIFYNEIFKQTVAFQAVKTIVRREAQSEIEQPVYRFSLVFTRTAHLQQSRECEQLPNGKQNKTN